MNYLVKNKKITLGILAIIIIISICYYIYSENTNFLSIQEQNLEIDEQKLENSNTEDKNTVNQTQEENNVIIVHVSGAVNQPGIVELSENSRITDAIEKAGGLKQEACIDEINLAYVLEDGMKIHIPTVDEQKKNNDDVENKDNLYITSESNLSSEKNNNQKKTGKININTATQEELETLPGIGPSTSLKIIKYRNENGKFKSIEDIKEVSGIGESKFNNIKDMISI